MDIVSLLKKDHKEVNALFEQVEAASPRAVKSKQALFAQIKAALTLHAAAEEKILYPRMRELNKLRQSAFEADEEHRLVKQMLEELASLDGGETWDAKMKVLIDLVRHHVKEEEGEYFKTLKSQLDASELRTLGEQVESFKAAAKPERRAPSNRRAASGQTLHS